MADFILTAESAFDGYDETFERVRLREPKDLAIASIALPMDRESAAEDALKSAFGIEMPDVGNSALTADGTERLLRLGREQYFVLFSRGTPDAEKFIAGRLNGAVYTTDQTDVWASLEISGEGSIAALERICPLDLHPEVFEVGSVARTSTEHLGTLIMRTDADTFLLLSARSSAGSFLHAVELSIRNTK